MSFLYIEPYEVRHEILARVKDLENWIDLDYDLEDFIEVEEQDSLKNLIVKFLSGKNPLRIDGQLQTPILDRIHFVIPSISGIQILEAPKRLAYSSAIIGVIFIYPNPGIPQEVTVDWELFTDQTSSIPTIATDPAGPMPYFLQPDDNILTWTNFLKTYRLPTVTEQKVTTYRVKVPLLSVFLLIAGLILLQRNQWKTKGMTKFRRVVF